MYVFSFSSSFFFLFYSRSLTLSPFYVPSFYFLFFVRVKRLFRLCFSSFSFLFFFIFFFLLSLATLSFHRTHHVPLYSHRGIPRSVISDCTQTHSSVCLDVRRNCKNEAGRTFTTSLRRELIAPRISDRVPANSKVSIASDSKTFTRTIQPWSRVVSSVRPEKPRVFRLM